mmetsp:Transcript_28887/g.66782  ORF Transcript_28887/g.66782 Transcript_28887/m.66782 type:complete len:233 (+) Transcript_28887:735-1433(+)
MATTVYRRQAANKIQHPSSSVAMTPKHSVSPSRAVEKYFSMIALIASQWSPTMNAANCLSSTQATMMESTKTSRADQAFKTSVATNSRLCVAGLRGICQRKHSESKCSSGIRMQNIIKVAWIQRIPGILGSGLASATPSASDTTLYPVSTLLPKYAKAIAATPLKWNAKVFTHTPQHTSRMVKKSISRTKVRPKPVHRTRVLPTRKECMPSASLLPLASSRSSCARRSLSAE